MTGLNPKTLPYRHRLLRKRERPSRVTGQRKGEGDSPDLGKLAAFSGVSEYPVRVKCATLAWHTLRAALHGEHETVSTE